MVSDAHDLESHDTLRLYNIALRLMLTNAQLSLLDAMEQRIGSVGRRSFESAFQRVQMNICRSHHR